MPDDLVITGLGCVTPLGVGVDETWRALCGGAFITDVGRVVETPDPTRSRVAQLGLLAAREAIAGLADDFDADAALVVGTSKGPVDAWLASAAANDRAARGARDGEHRRADHASTSVLPCPPQQAADAAYGLAGLAADLATDLRIGGTTGARLTLSAACASGLHALARAALLLRTSATRRAIVVASESSLDPLWFGTFRNLGVLAPPGQPCRPLDVDRKGFVMSEAAAAIVLERRPARAGELTLDSWAIAADATHLTGIDPSGRTVRSLLGQVTTGEAVDLVHAHATATANDVVELDTIRATLGDRPTVYSHKGSFGHTLGASSLLAVVLNAKMHETGDVPPMPTTTRPITPPTRPPAKVERSLCLAAGFGGALAAAMLRTAD